MPGIFQPQTLVARLIAALILFAYVQLLLNLLAADPRALFENDRVLYVENRLAHPAGQLPKPLAEQWLLESQNIHGKHQQAQTPPEERNPTITADQFP